jgi:hypothetical protein
LLPTPPCLRACRTFSNKPFDVRLYICIYRPHQLDAAKTMLTISSMESLWFASPIAMSDLRSQPPSGVSFLPQSMSNFSNTPFGRTVTIYTISQPLDFEKCFSSRTDVLGLCLSTSPRKVSFQHHPTSGHVELFQHSFLTYGDYIYTYTVLNKWTMSQQSSQGLQRHHCYLRVQQTFQIFAFRRPRERFTFDPTLAGYIYLSPAT